jgi:enterobactin synthetase component D / holo-[acyl-carrier protein] synthase
VLEEILPLGAACAASRQDLEAPLFPEEEALVRGAVEKRRREFATARACARSALAHLGFPSQAIRTGPRGDPCWPDGVVGSITHCTGYRAAAVGRTEDFLAIGIDAEPDEELPDGVLGAIATAPERAWLGQRSLAADGICWGRLLFSIKEAIYKACDPLVPGTLAFEHATVTVDHRHRTFSARLFGPAVMSAGLGFSSLSGRWLAREGLVLAAVGLPAPRHDLWRAELPHS